MVAVFVAVWFAQAGDIEAQAELLGMSKPQMYEARRRLTGIIEQAIEERDADEDDSGSDAGEDAPSSRR